jgi:catechol-2,3-dioxygenase
MDPQVRQPDRRRFLSCASAAAALFAGQGSMAANTSPPESRLNRREKADPRILGLELLSSAPLDKMKEFYCQSLGLRLLVEQPDRLTIAAGQTEITFQKAGPHDGKPFYHFAFNIPENKILTARNWQRKRTPLLPIPARQRDAKYPDDVVDYNHWNAHSIFFFDSAGNVVEYIARHDLQNAAPGDFGSADILYASEIAFVVDDVRAVAARLKEVVGVDQYRAGNEQFTALGDEHGLLLVMKRGRVISFDAPEKKAVSVFRTMASVRGVKQTCNEFAGYPYQVSVRA